MGDRAPSEWGTLASLLVHEAPARFHFAYFRGKELTVGSVPKGETRLRVRQGKLLPDESVGTMLQLLISSDRVLETPPAAPERVLDKVTMGERSLHLIVGYEGRREWRSWYSAAAVPGHLRSFLDDCRAFGDRLGTPAPIQ